MKKLLLLPALLMLASMLCAQSTSIGISAIVNTPQVVNYHDTASYSFAVKNYGPNTFNGDIYIYTGIWDTSMTYVGVIRIDSTSLINLQNFNAGDSIWLTDVENYIPQNFRIGTSVVVIWPVSGNAFTQDSISYTVTVQSGTRVIEVTGNREISIYPNPAQGKLVIGTWGLPSETYVEQVRIMNASGQIVLLREGAGTLDIGHLDAGMYFIELRMSDSSRKIYRIVKQPE